MTDLMMSEPNDYPFLLLINLFIFYFIFLRFDGPSFDGPPTTVTPYNR